MDNEKPKIVCLQNGPYYLLNDMEPRVVPNIQTPSGGYVPRSQVLRYVAVVHRKTSHFATARTGA